MSSLDLNSSLGIFKVNVKVETEAKYQLAPKKLISVGKYSEVYFSFYLSLR